MNKKNIFISLNGIILVVVFIAVVCILIKNKQYINKLESQVSIYESQKSNQYVPADWQVYTNNLFGFQIKYPIGWSIKEYGNAKAFKVTRESAEELDLDQFDINLSDANSVYDCYVSKKGTIKLGDYEWEMEVWNKGFTQGLCSGLDKFPKNKPVMYLHTNTSGKNVEIIIGNRTELDDTDKKVISTIKFFNP